MDLTEVLKQLAIAFGLGLLVGLQRERSESPLAGIRTFPIITMFGTLCALLGQSFGGWVVAMGLAGLAAVVVAGNVLYMKSTEPDPGLTTEVTMLVMFGIGAYLVVGFPAAGIAVGGGVAVLLHLKPEMHSFAGKIGDSDFKAIMQFALISLVILPVLPNKFYGPYEVLNPFRVWLMVVLIVGISLGGYVAYKSFGQKAGALIGGLLGGLISSTATTVGYARIARSTPQVSGLAVFVILVASAVSFARVIALIGATAPGLLKQAAVPLGLMCGVLVLLSGAAGIANRRQEINLPQHGNPSELKPAILFAALFAIVLLGTAAGKEWFGERGLYAVAGLSGLTDMDAITLSVTQMVNRQSVAAETAWRLILVASLANLVFKFGMVAVLGNRKLTIYIGLLFAVVFGAGVLVFLLWPAAAVETTKLRGAWGDCGVFAGAARLFPGG